MQLACELSESSAMKTVFFGTPNYATGSIRALLSSGIEVSLICTRPPRRAGRGRRLTPTPVAELGNQLKITVITPERLDADAIERIQSVGADAFVVVAYGRFIPNALLEHLPLGVLNIHPSLLPKHRGPSPVATAILDGDSHTGATVMLLDEGMDSGPILMQSAPVQITPEDRCDALTERLFALGSDMLPDALTRLASGEITARQQNHDEATITALIRKEDGQINWRDSADRITRMNRAFHPWPGTATTWRGQPFKVVDATPANVLPATTRAASGTVFKGDDGEVYVVAGNGSSLKLVTVQQAGRRAMAVSDFVVGQPEFVGSQLGAESI